METSKHSNSYCEAWIENKWKIIPVEQARDYSGTKIRCLECQGAVRIHRAGPNNRPRAHAEHLNRFKGCSLGDCFDGNKRFNPEKGEST